MTSPNPSPSSISLRVKSKKGIRGILRTTHPRLISMNEFTMFKANIHCEEKVFRVSVIVSVHAVGDPEELSHP